MTSEQLPFYIGRYKVTGRLGSGGMGVVYLATDERLHRRVAIKRLHKNPTSSSAHLRIRQEALLLAQLNHSNIVQIYDVVEERGNVALVMEYVDGCTLDHWQRERNPNLQQKIQLLIQISGGLSRAHSMGIIHRDLKADNILVDNNHTAKITDFGIAKSWRENSDLTREQHVAGSWGAMSPEQAQGSSLDNRSDLFSLGVLAYKLLCGQNPFGDCESPFVIADRIVNSQHPPAAKLNPDLPPALCHLLDRLLAKTPDKRPLNASAVAAELEAIAANLESREPDTAASRTITITAEEYHRRKQRGGKHRKRIAVVAVTLLTGVAAALFAYTQHLPEGKYIAVVLPEDKTGERKEVRLLDSTVLSAVKQGLADREGLYLVPYSESQPLRGQPLRQQAQKLNVQLLLSPSLSCGISLCEMSLDLIDTKNLTVVASRSTKLELSSNLESRARTLQQIDFLLPRYPARSGGGEPNISEDDYRRYLELFERFDDYRNLESLQDDLEELQERAPLFTPIYELYGSVVYMNRQISRNQQTVERLEKLLHKLPRQLADAPEVLQAKLIVAIFRDNREEAQSLLARLKLTMPDQSNYYTWKSHYHSHQGEFEQALVAIDRALAQRTGSSQLLQKALILTQMGKMEEARPYLQQVLKIDGNDIDAIDLLAANELDSGRPRETIRLLNQVGIDKLDALQTYNLCLAYYVEEQYEPAWQCLDKALAMAPAQVDVLLYQSEIARQLEQPQKARDKAEKALALTRDSDDWQGLLLHARAQAELGRASAAVETLLKTRRQAPDDLYVNYNRAQIYIATGDLISAKAHIRKTLELGMSPLWLTVGRFKRICSEEGFADLRADYPTLCPGKTQSTHLARQ